MYKLIRKEDIVRIPPDKLGGNYEEVVRELAQSNFEGKVTDGNLILVVTNIKLIDDGMILHGDGGVYQKVQYRALVYRPELHEVIEGTVCEILRFGAFIRFGPLDGLLHISQIMTDRIDVDLAGERLIGKETKRDLRVGDKVRARIVALSLNERNPRESKIGLTMRQPGLGKFEWLEDERKGIRIPVGKAREGRRGRRRRRKKR